MIKEDILFYTDESNHTIDNNIYRKTFKHMTKEERLYLLLKKDYLLEKGVVFAKHALKRMDERYIKEKDVLRALKNGQILEYKKMNNDDLIVVRGFYINRRKEQIYVIFSLNENKVITTYSNKHWNSYKKMKCLEKYTIDFNIFIPDYFKHLIQFYFS